MEGIEERCGGLEGRSVVDVGCGGGIAAEAMARAGAAVVGLDLAAEALGAARDHATANGVVVESMRVTARGFGTRKYTALHDHRDQ